MSPGHPSQETFARFRWGNRTGAEAGRAAGPRVADGQHLQGGASLCSAPRLWRSALGRTTNYPRHRPRAKVGGCGERGAPIALISVCIAFLLSERPPCPSLIIHWHMQIGLYLIPCRGIYIPGSLLISYMRAREKRVETTGTRHAPPPFLISFLYIKPGWALMKTLTFIPS